MIEGPDEAAYLANRIMRIVIDEDTWDPQKEIEIGELIRRHIGDDGMYSESDESDVWPIEREELNGVIIDKPGFYECLNGNKAEVEYISKDGVYAFGFIGNRPGTTWRTNGSILNYVQLSKKFNIVNKWKDELADGIPTKELGDDDCALCGVPKEDHKECCVCGYSKLNDSGHRNLCPLDHDHLPIPKVTTIIDRVIAEVVKQNNKWGTPNNSPDKWAVIIIEEIGEVCRANLEDDSEGYIKELVQVAAVAISAAESFNKHKNGSDSEPMIDDENTKSQDFVIDNIVRRRGDCSSCPKKNCHTYSKGEGDWICLACFMDRYKCKISDLNGVRLWGLPARQAKKED